MRILVRAIVSMLAITLGVSGCGSPTAVLPAEGVVLGPDGKPMANILVMFTPVDTGGRKVVSSTGVTDENGKFALKADDGQVGAIAGKHKVTVIDNAFGAEEDEPKAGTRKKAVNRVVAIYASPTTTPLEAVVEAGKTHELKLNR